MYYVYVLSSLKYTKSYVGTCDNIDRRITEHNAGKMIFSRRYKPWKIIHLEEYKTLAVAGRRERYLKSGRGRILLKRIFDNYSRVV